MHANSPIHVASAVAKKRALTSLVFKVVIRTAVSVHVMIAGPLGVWAQDCDFQDLQPTSDVSYSSSCCTDACGLPHCNSCGSASLCENLSLFLGLEGSKQPQDFGVNAHFGGRFHANWGFPISVSNGLGLQIGAAINETRNAVQVVERVEGSKSRTQLFTTIGLFQRCPSGWNWALTYDHLNQDYFDDFSLGQWRGHLGYWLDGCTEIGVRVARSDGGDDGFFTTIPVSMEAITQGSLYGRKVWPTAAVTGFWVGIAEGHGETNVALGDLPPVNQRFTFGSDIFCPLTNRLAIFGEANFISPADTGTVDAYLGLVYHFGGNHRVFTRRFAPVLPVANNTSMSVDLTR